MDEARGESNIGTAPAAEVATPSAVPPASVPGHAVQVNETPDPVRAASSVPAATAPSDLAVRFGLRTPTASATPDAAATDGTAPSAAGTATQQPGDGTARALTEVMRRHEADLPFVVQDAQRFQAEDPDALPRALVAAHQEGLLPPELAEVVAELRVEQGRFQAAEAWVALEQEEGD